jgi:uncharacterized membrane-anchored protein YitT (DUF2179 family)
MSGDVEILYTIIKRRDLARVVSIIEGCQSNVFYSVEDAKSVNQGIFPAQEKRDFFRLEDIRRRNYRKKGK